MQTNTTEREKQRERQRTDTSTRVRTLHTMHGCKRLRCVFVCGPFGRRISRLRPLAHVVLLAVVRWGAFLALLMDPDSAGELVLALCVPRARWVVGGGGRAFLHCACCGELCCAGPRAIRFAGAFRCGLGLAGPCLFFGRVRACCAFWCSGLSLVAGRRPFSLARYYSAAGQSNLWIASIMRVGSSKLQAAGLSVQLWAVEGYAWEALGPGYHGVGP